MPTVTAVLVTHDGTPWLADVLAAVSAQTRRPDRLVAVDTASADGSRDVVAASGLATTTVDLPRRASYPRAVAAALATAPAVTGPAAAAPAVTAPAAAAPATGRAATTPATGPATTAPAGPEWVWLLHDDSAPAPGALAALLATAAAHPRTALVGPVVVAWDDPTRLLEAGLGVAGDGRRRSGVEPGERDQGQYDDTRPVLAVGTAGALVRRDAYDAVGGLERRLPWAGHDVDLGWRLTAAGHEVRVSPGARVRHAAALSRGRRSGVGTRRTRPAVGSARGAAAARRAGLWTLLADTPAAGLPALLLRLVLGGVLGVLAAVARRRWRAAAATVARGTWLLPHLPGLLVARVRRRRRRVPWSLVRELLPPPQGDQDSGLAGVIDRISVGGRREPRGDAAGPLDLLVTATALGGVAAVSALGTQALRGPGLLAGGRLLGPPADLAAAWASATTGTVDTGAGAAGTAGARDLLLGALGALPGSTPSGVVAVLLLGTPLLAALAATWAARPLTGSLGLRASAGAAYGLTPVATGAVAGGRLDTAAVVVALPLLLRGGRRLLTRDPRSEGWHPVWLTGLGLAASAALAPVLLAAAAVLAPVGAAAVLLRTTPARTGSALRRGLGGGLAVVVAAAVLLPDLTLLRDDPGALLHGPGRTGAEVAAVPPWHLLLLQPGGPGAPALWAYAGVVVAALAGLLARERRRTALTGWALAVAGLAGGVAAQRLPVPLPGGGPDALVWPGPATALVAAGLLVAALAGADGVRERLRRRTFGWRQPTAVLVALAAAAGPVVAGAALVEGLDGPLLRRPLPVPAQAAVAIDRDRVLVLRAATPVDYELTTATGTPLLADRATPAAAAADRLDQAVRALLTADGRDSTPALAAYSVRVLALAPGGRPADRAAVAAALDTQPGLVRAGGGDDLWRLRAALPRRAVLPPDLARVAARGSVPTGTSAMTSARAVAGTVPAGPTGRLLVLSRAVDPELRAELDGTALRPATAWGWAQAFVLPATGGELVVERRPDPERRRVLLAGGAALLLALLLAVPAGRPRAPGGAP